MQTGDELEWGIKDSLLAYVQGLDGGVVAWQPEQRPKEFRLLHGEDSCDRLLRFAGGVRLQGHGGMLRIVIASPCIDLDNGMLLVRVPQADDPVAILQLGDADTQPSDGGFVITYAAPRLTPDGVIVFGGFYRENERFDPIVVRLRQDTAMRLIGARQARGGEARED